MRRPEQAPWPHPARFQALGGGFLQAASSGTLEIAEGDIPAPTLVPKEKHNPSTPETFNLSSSPDS